MPRAHSIPSALPVTVIELGETHALCLDEYGVHRQVSHQLRRGKGLMPRPGDVWLIERFAGQWQLSVCIQAAGATVEGTVVPKSAQDNLLKALDDLGVVDDQAERAPDWGRWMNVNP